MPKKSWPSRLFCLHQLTWHEASVFTSICQFISVVQATFICFVRFSWQVHVCAEIAESGITPLYWCTAHYVEMLLQAEVPLVHSAFRMSGFTPSQVRHMWTAAMGMCSKSDMNRKCWHFVFFPQMSCKVIKEEQRKNKAFLCDFYLCNLIFSIIHHEKWQEGLNEIEKHQY